MNNTDIQVSVCVVTYNQENYIAECLESLVSQQTKFKFEIIVGEDCSTDLTRKIVQKYVEQYPDLIVPLFYKKNVGAVENIKQVYKLAKGKYIAHIDGDDFALPNKLQKQYEKMEQGFVICSHNVCSIDQYGDTDKAFWHFKDGEYSWKFYMKNMPFFAHSSKMFVKEHLIKFIECMEENTYDFELHLESLKFGSIYHIGENLGVYRLNVGLMVSDKQILIKMIDTKIRVYEKSLSYFNDFMFVKKSYILALLKMLKLCFIQKKYNKINQILIKLMSVMVRFK